MLVQVAVGVDFRDQAGEQQTMQQNLQNISLKTGAPMESHAATILTPFAFSKLQEQLVLAAHYATFQMDDGFLVRHHTKVEGGRKVYWVPREGIISCSCHQFEFSGILSRTRDKSRDTCSVAISSLSWDFADSVTRVDTKLCNN